MSVEKKRARPSVGALGRAVETGSAMQADTTSKPQFTPNGPGGQRKVADLLSHGRENAIPRRELEKLTGLDGRTVRLMIERERREGSPILADNATGYYLRYRARTGRLRALHAPQGRGDYEVSPGH